MVLLEKSRENRGHPLPRKQVLSGRMVIGVLLGVITWSFGDRIEDIGRVIHLIVPLSIPMTLASK